MKSFLMSKKGKVAVGLVSLVVIWFGWKSYRDAQEERLWEEKAAEELKPVAEAMKSSAGRPYDIEETIRVMNSLDVAIQENGNFQDYLSVLSRQDYSKVAPDVLEARLRILRVLTRLNLQLREQEELESYIAYAREITHFALAAVQVAPGAGSGFKVVSSVMALNNGLERIEEQIEMRKDLRRKIESTRSELSELLFEYSSIFCKYLEEWDRICLLRDRAYLAMNQQAWDEVIAASREVLALNPSDKEALLLKSLGLIERGNPQAWTQEGIQDSAGSDSDEREHPVEALKEYLRLYPGRSAPALLLSGVMYSKLGDFKNAELYFAESAVYYPKQADLLLDMLNPYKMRSYLRKTREGNLILRFYKSSMLGAGYYSPDLQMARMYFDRGNNDKGKRKVLDHFSRRRNQSQWDYILEDMAFCEGLMGDDFTKLFPEDSYLELVGSTSTFSKEFSIRVKNRSDVQLNNVSLILCIQYTDMHRDDFETFRMERSVPAVLPLTETDFGSLDVTFELFGKTKGVDDIVSERAVAISNEAVVWVDTEKFRVARLRENQVQAVENTKLLQSTGLSKDKLVEKIRTGSKVSVQKNLITNDVLSVSLPRELALLRPVFRLNASGHSDPLTPSSYQIKGNSILLDFKGKLAAADEMGIDILSPHVVTKIQIKRKEDGELMIASINLD